MFQPPRCDVSRVLIASADAASRRAMADIAKAADLRAVGFVREAQQVAERTTISLPDVLMLDLDTLEQARSGGLSLQETASKGALRVVVCGTSVPVQLAGRLKQDGVHLLLDLANPLAGTSEGLGRLLRQGLMPAAVPLPQPATARVAATTHAVPSAARKTLRPCSVVIGSSTGGPVALMTLIRALPADFPLPIAVVQHMPAGFTQLLAERLDAECAIRVVEAAEGMPLRPGTVFIAPGGFHMALQGTPRACHIALNLQDPENSCRPAVDVLFRSSAEVYGGRQHAVILTGMGRDGCQGAAKLHALGTRITVQDAATSTVWGMPGAVAQAGLADDVLPIHDIAAHLLRCL